MSERQTSEETAHSPVIGWGAVVLPSMRIRKGILIRESDIEPAKALDAHIRVSMATPAARRDGIVRKGVLSSFLVELVSKGMEVPQLSACAYLLMMEVGTPYWWVEGREEERGITTSIFSLEANSPEEAEAALADAPRIKLLDMMGLFEMIGAKRKRND